MAPFLNSTTVGFMVTLSLHFRSRIRHIPLAARQIFAYLCVLFFTISFCLGITVVTTILGSPSSNLKSLSPLPIVQLHSVTFKSLTTTAVNLTATFLFENHNRKLAVSYTDLEARLWFGNDEVTLASTGITAFTQRSESVRRVDVELTAVDGFGAERVVGGKVRFGVSLLGWVRFGNGVLRTRSVEIRAVCDRVVIVLPPGSNTSGTLVSPLVCGE